MSYKFTRPEEPTFTQKGLKGFQFPVKNGEVEVYFVDVEKGHDNFIISKKITHIYYILEGKGYFTIDGQRIAVEPGELVEVPPNVEYSFSGSMKIILVMPPPFFPENEQITKKNPNI